MLGLYRAEICRCCDMRWALRRKRPSKQPKASSDSTPSKQVRPAELARTKASEETSTDYSDTPVVQEAGRKQSKASKADGQGAATRTRSRTGATAMPDKDKAATAGKAAQPKDNASKSKAASKQQAQHPKNEAESKPAAKNSKGPQLVQSDVDLSEGKRDKNGTWAGCSHVTSLAQERQSAL